MGNFKASNTNVLVMNADDLEVDSGTLSVDATNNRVGIGLTTPKTELTVEGTITLKEAANASSDTAAYGQLWVKSNAPCDLFFTDDSGQDIRITNDGSLAAAPGASVAADDINAGDSNVSITGGSGHSLTLNATAAQAQLKTTTSGEIDITSAANIDINATTGIAADGTTVSIDGTDDSNFTVTGSGKDLDLIVAGGGTQEIRLTSAGTGAAAINIDTSAGGIDIDSADMITVDAADEITITTTSADGHISLVSAHTAGVAFHIDANADADSEVQIDAGILDIDVTAAATIDAVGVAIGAGSGELDLTTTGTLDINANALTMDLTDSSVITITSSEAAEDLTIAQVGANDSSIIITAAGTGADAISIDATAGSMVIGASLANAKTLTLGNTDSTYLQLIPHGTAASEKILLYNAAGTADDAIKIHSDAGGITIKADNDSIHIDADGTDADALNIDSAGGIDVDAAGAISLDSSAGSIDINVVDGQTVSIGLNGGVEQIIAPHGTAGSELYSVINTAGTTDGTDAAGAILLSAVAGGIGLAWADDKDLWAEGGQAVITANHNAVSAIKLHADAGAAQTIDIINDEGTAKNAIIMSASAGGIDVNAAKLIHMSGSSMTLTGSGAMAIDSTYGSITVGAALADGQTLKLGKNGAVETIIAPHGTAGSEKYSVTNTAGTSVMTDGNSDASVQLVSTAGGIGLRATSNLAGAIQIEADGGTDETIVIKSDQGTGEGNGNASIELLSDAGGICFTATGLTGVMTDGNSDAAIQAHAAAGGIGLRSTANLAGSIQIEADGGASETIIIHSDQGTGAGSIQLTSDVGGITISGDTDHGVIVGNISGAPVTIGHTTSETTVSDNLTVTGTSLFSDNATFGADDTGVDVRFFSATASEGLLYDASEDELGLLLTTKLKFHDIGGGEEIFASADGHLEVNAGTTLDMTAPTIDLNASTAVTVDSDLVTFGSANAADPLVIIKNTTDDTASARLRFVKDRGAAGEDNDNIGTIEFYGDDDNEDNIEFASIGAQVADASNGAEGGRLVLRVASHNGTMQSGLTIQDGDAAGELDVTIGNGAASLTTVAGEMKVTEDFFQGDARRVIYEEVDVRKCHSSEDTVSVQFGNKIPQDSVVTRVVALVKTASNVGGHTVNIRFDVGDGRAADYDASSTSSEALGGGASTTRSSTNVGSAVDIDMTSAKESYINDTPSFMTTADVYPYVMNASDNGTNDATQGTLLIYIEYYGID